MKPTQEQLKKPAFVPKVGEWYQYADKDKHRKNGPVFFIGFNQDGEAVYSNAYNHIFRMSSAIELRPEKSERELLIDIIVAHGNLSEGVLADGILNAGFCLKEADK